MKIFKKSKVILMFLAGLWILTQCSLGMGQTPDYCKLGMGQTSKSGLRLWIGYWRSRADASWQISFIRQSEGRKPDKFVSRLKYNDIDANPVSLEIDVLPYNQLFGLNFFFVVSAPISTGHSRDTDYMNDNKFSESRNTVDGRVDLWSLEGQMLLSPQSLSPFRKKIAGPLLSWRWHGIFGFQHYQDSLRMFNGEKIIPDSGEENLSASTRSSEPFFGLDSHYTFTWDAVKLGLKSTCNLDCGFIPVCYSLEISGKATPLLARYSGEGLWNLRPDFDQNPSFQHESYGYGLDAALSIIYRPWSIVGVELGWKYLRLTSKGGEDTTYFSSGEKETAMLDEVDVLREGWFIRGIISF